MPTSSPNSGADAHETNRLGRRDDTWTGFIGFKTATSEELPDAVAVMDPFHVARLAGDALNQCPPPRPAGHLWAPRPQRTRYVTRRTLHTGSDLLTDQQRNSAPQERSSRVRQSSPSGGV